MDRNDEGYDFNFIRVLRPTKSELGDFDKAALFEHAKMNSIKYYSKVGYSCLVEADEEPPHEVSKDALETALLFSLALNSNIVDEIHVMRKLVIDGSNVSGFQRTMLISTGGYLEVDNFNKRRPGYMFRRGCSKINFYQSSIKGIRTRQAWDPASRNRT